MPTPTTLNEALAEIDVLNTQIAYLTEQANIAAAITNKVIPDNSTELTAIATNIENVETAIEAVETALTSSDAAPTVPSTAPMIVRHN